MTREELLQLFDDTTAHCRATMVKKNTDYCAGEANAAVDPFANFRISECVGVNPVLGLMMRMMDKMQRIRAFVADGKLAVAEETVDDAFDDMVNYAILGKGLMRDMRAKKLKDVSFAGLIEVLDHETREITPEEISESLRHREDAARLHDKHF